MKKKKKKRRKGGRRGEGREGRRKIPSGKEAAATRVLVERGRARGRAIVVIRINSLIAADSTFV